MQLDKNGDSEGNFSVLALTNVLASNNNDVVINTFTCKYQMRQVGQFQQGEFPVSEFAQNFYVCYDYLFIFLFHVSYYLFRYII